jgi:outer membrane protein TolC
MRGLLSAAALAASLAPRAAPPEETRHAVTLSEALTRAPQLAEVRAALAGQQVAAANARAAGKPGDLGVSFATRSQTARESVSASLPLPWLGPRGARLDVAHGEERVAAAETRSALADAEHDLRVAWFALAAAEERRRVAAEQTARARRNAQAVGDLFEAGRVARLEVKRAEAEAAITGADDVAAEEVRRGASAGLALLLGLPAESDVVAAGERPSPAEEEPLALVLERAQAGSAEVRVETATLDTAEARVHLAGRLRWPGLALEGGADINDPTLPGTDAWIGVALTIPLSGGSALAAAQGERSRQSLRLELARRRAAAAAQSAWSAARTARLRYEALDGQALPAAREGAELARLAYREGRSDLFRLLDAERTLSEVERDRIDAYRSWAEADAERRRLTGGAVP